MLSFKWTLKNLSLIKANINLKEINKLAIPAILFNITEPIIGLADIAFIGQMEEDSTIAQGGVGLAVGLISTLIWGFAQMRTSLSSIISRHFGQKKLDRIYTLIPQSILLTLLIGIIIALLTAVFYNPIANLIYGNISTQTFKFSSDYFIIRSFGLPISLLIALFFGIFRGYQNTSWAMVISLIGGSVNIILDMIEKNKDLLNYLSPKNWAKNINIKTFIMHGANDSMIPFTESTMLASKIKNSNVLISFLYEHREISNNRGILFKIKEILKMIHFFALYFKFNKWKL